MSHPSKTLAECGGKRASSPHARVCAASTSTEYCTRPSHLIMPATLDVQLRLPSRLWKSRWPRRSRLRWTKSTGNVQQPAT
eukprot:scaffold16995_cov127-Isochrysis_galbana.AAC.16